MVESVVDVPSALEQHYRRCVPALARLRMAAGDEEAVVSGSLGSQITAEVSLALDDVLEELRAAESIIVDRVCGTSRARPISSFLAVRLTRLEVAAADVVAASGLRDLPAYRRALQKFHALTTAMWKVQLGVYSSATGDTRRPHRGMAAPVWPGRC